MIVRQMGRIIKEQLKSNKFPNALANGPQLDKRSIGAKKTAEKATIGAKITATNATKGSPTIPWGNQVDRMTPTQAGL